jgi:cysteinyl-tRNA synthetase
LADDLNTHAALAILDKAADENKVAELVAGLDFMGILTVDEVERRVNERRQHIAGLQPLADHLYSVWAQSKATKNFVEVDRLKQQLEDAGVLIKMGKDGVTLEPGVNFDPATVSAIA